MAELFAGAEEPPPRPKKDMMAGIWEVDEIGVKEKEGQEVASKRNEQSAFQVARCAKKDVPSSEIFEPGLT